MHGCMTAEAQPVHAGATCELKTNKNILHFDVHPMQCPDRGRANKDTEHMGAQRQQTKW